jgi:hypothetical protein
MRLASIKQRVKVVHLYEADGGEASRIRAGNSAFSRRSSAFTAPVIGVSLEDVFMGRSMSSHATSPKSQSVGFSAAPHGSSK